MAAMVQKTCLFLLSIVVLYGLNTAFAAEGMRLQPLASNAQSIDAPLLATDIRIEISGPIARTRVRQLFQNPSKVWTEGVYVFPLPEDAGVDEMRFIVGDRVIQGVIKERAEAQRIYEQAKHKGQRASLINQERANIFTTALANIAPGDQIAVEIEFQETLDFDDGDFTLRFPTIVAPRYIPGQKPVIGVGGHGIAGNTDQVSDAERISPPVRHPDAGAINPVAFTIQINGAEGVHDIRSVSHKIIQRTENTAAIINLAGGALPADRDFVLEWRSKSDIQTAVNLYKEVIGGETYLLAMIQPPSLDHFTATKPREVIYVIDTSGSMSGVSLNGAKAALQQALGRLQPEDRFNIVRFASTASALYPTAHRASPDALLQARAFAADLTSDGGTEFLSALKIALNDEIDNSRMRQVVFLTDGAVGNDTEVLSFIRRNLGDSRLFTIGIGSAPNSYLMRKAAEFGHGTFSYIESEDQVAERMIRLFARLEAPVLNNLSAAFHQDPAAEMWPARLPDLYAGEPVMITARLTKDSGNLSLTAHQDNADWSLMVDLDEAQHGKGIARFWARQKIENLMDRRHDGFSNDEIRRLVLPVALQHHLVSQYSSLVAVELEIARPEDKVLISRAMASNLPHGWNFEKVFGPTAPAAVPNLLKKTNFSDASGRQIALKARGATPALLQTAIGLGIILLALACLLGYARRQRASA
jgi:Ca-activated chloride channel family protein